MMVHEVDEEFSMRRLTAEAGSEEILFVSQPLHAQGSIELMVSRMRNQLVEFPETGVIHPLNAGKNECVPQIVNDREFVDSQDVRNVLDATGCEARLQCRQQLWWQQVARCQISSSTRLRMNLH